MHCDVSALSINHVVADSNIQAPASILLRFIMRKICRQKICRLLPWPLTFWTDNIIHSTACSKFGYLIFSLSWLIMQRDIFATDRRTDGVADHSAHGPRSSTRLQSLLSLTLARTKGTPLWSACPSGSYTFQPTLRSFPRRKWGTEWVGELLPREGQARRCVAHSASALISSRVQTAATALMS